MFHSLVASNRVNIKETGPRVKKKNINVIWLKIKTLLLNCFTLENIYLKELVNMDQGKNAFNKLLCSFLYLLLFLLTHLWLFYI